MTDSAVGGALKSDMERWSLEALKRRRWGKRHLSGRSTENSQVFGGASAPEEMSDQKPGKFDVTIRTESQLPSLLLLRTLAGIRVGQSRRCLLSLHPAPATCSSPPRHVPEWSCGNVYTEEWLIHICIYHFMYLPSFVEHFQVRNSIVTNCSHCVVQ